VFFRRKGGKGKEVSSSIQSGSLNQPSEDASVIEIGQARSLETELAYRGSRNESRLIDPLGLTVVYQPPGRRVVDIVFVHGLGGTSMSTWSKNRNPDKFWPGKFLPMDEYFSEARILTFGYDASFRSKSDRSALTLNDFAKDLLFNLKHAKVGGAEDGNEGASSRIGEVFTQR
jgi:hypothetical protein